MFDAVLVDLARACSLTCAGADQLADPAAAPHMFILCGKQSRDSCSFLKGRAHILDRGSTAERLYRFKQILDRLDLSSVRVMTTTRGKQVLSAYQEELFTHVYSFEYQVRPEDSCPSCVDSAHADSPGEDQKEEVSLFLQNLPALKGDLRVLQSTLIPGESIQAQVWLRIPVVLVRCPLAPVSLTTMENHMMVLQPVDLFLCCRLLRSRFQYSCRGRVLHPNTLRPQPVLQPDQAGPQGGGPGEPAAPGPPRWLPPSTSSFSQGRKGPLLPSGGWP